VCLVIHSMDYVGAVVDEIALEGLDGKNNVCLLTWLLGYFTWLLGR